MQPNRLKDHFHHTLLKGEPRDYDVVIDIQFCGICHTDIHQIRNEWGGSSFPMVPGHEIIGTVSGIGSKVTRYKIGDRVGVGCFVDSCRKCEPCRKGLSNIVSKDPL
jgi:alcohol dehydrogenase (NADP+)